MILGLGGTRVFFALAHSIVAPWPGRGGGRGGGGVMGAGSPAAAARTSLVVAGDDTKKIRANRDFFPTHSTLIRLAPT